MEKESGQHCVARSITQEKAREQDHRQMPQSSTVLRL